MIYIHTFDVGEAERFKVTWDLSRELVAPDVDGGLLRSPLSRGDCRVAVAASTFK